MNASEIKEFLSETDIISLLEGLGAEPQQQGNNIFCKTICHHGNKKKLVYFNHTKTFTCFTDSCGSMDIFGLIGKVMNLDFFNSFKFVCMKFGISYKGVTHNPNKVDMSFFQKFKRNDDKIELKVLDKKLLDSYYDLYHKSWINDGITVRTMEEFNIKYAISTQQIIIPHYDLHNQLIGVRARNLNEELVEDGKKYMPVYYKGEVLKHPTGAALYGLNKTKKNVEKYKAVILFESEKSVLQLDSLVPDMSIGACISGSSLTYTQIDILKELEIDEVIIAMDKEFDEVGSKEEKFYAEKIKTVFLDKLSPYFRTSVIWDTEGLLDLKDSPTDKGKEAFTELFQKRLFV